MLESCILKMLEPACPQCAADEVLTVPLDVATAMIDAEVQQQWGGILAKSPQIVETLTGGEDRRQMVRVRARAMRLAARTVLLEPHECGRVDG